MTATPDSFSMSDLEAMLQDAPRDITDIQPEASENTDERQERLTSLAATTLDAMLDPLDGQDAAQVEKLILHLIAQKMVEWHSRVGHHMIEDGELKSGMNWHRDGGKFQAILNILDTITVGPEDFTCAVQ